MEKNLCVADNCHKIRNISSRSRYCSMHNWRKHTWGMLEKPQTKEQKFKDAIANKKYKGINAGYTAKHHWLYKWYGKASKCENTNCTYENPKLYEWANISGKYKRERDDYMQLCPSCHRKMDNARRKNV